MGMSASTTLIKSSAMRGTFLSAWVQEIWGQSCLFAGWQWLYYWEADTQDIFVCPSKVGMQHVLIAVSGL